MLKINLLPTYIAEQKRTRTAIVLASLIWLAILAGGLGYHFGVLMPQVHAKEDEAKQAEDDANRVTQFDSDTQSIRQKVAPIEDKVDFVKAVRFHNELYQKIYRNAAKYTYRNVEYASMSINGQLLAVNAYVHSLDDLGRFYLTMFGNPDVTAVSIQGIPNWDWTRQEYGGQQGILPGQGALPEQRGWFPVQMSASLVRPVVAPQLPASLGGGGTTGRGFAGGSPFGPGGGGYGGGPPMGGGYGGGPPAGYGGGPPMGGGAPAGLRPGKGRGDE
jgi:hypothetical protein